MDTIQFHLERLCELLNEKLNKEIDACVKKAIDEKLRGISNDTSEDKLLTTPELQKLLSLSKSSIEALKNQKMPFLRIGTTIRFNKGDVLKFLQQYKIEKGGADLNK